MPLAAPRRTGVSSPMPTIVTMRAAACQTRSMPPLADQHPSPGRLSFQGAMQAGKQGHLHSIIIGEGLECFL